MTTNGSSVGKAIQAELDAQGISQRELARRLGWSHTRVQRRMAGDKHISITDLEKIAATLGIAVSSFLADTERKT